MEVKSFENESNEGSPRSPGGRLLSLDYVASFFDGEGSINLKPRTHSVGTTLRISQVDGRVLDDISVLLSIHGVECRVYVTDRNRRHAIHALVVKSNDSVISALTLMVPYLRVKFHQAKVTLDYLHGKITGDQFIYAMNAEVRAGRRAGKIYFVNQPFTHSDGVTMVWNQSMARARQVFREMATTPDGHRRFGLNAIERNIKRGVETKKRILRSLCDGPKDTRAILPNSGV